VHERYRRQTTDRQTDGRAIAYSEREREFTFAKNGNEIYTIINFTRLSVLSVTVAAALAGDGGRCRSGRCQPARSIRMSL